MSDLPRPDVSDPATQTHLINLNTAIESELGDRTKDSSPRREVLLTAPDRSIWRVTVSNAGALTTTKVSNG